VRTSKIFEPTKTMNCICELDKCPGCGSDLEICDYVNGKKTVQTVSDIISLSYRGKFCPNSDCSYAGTSFKSSEWLQIAHLHGTYGYDVIALCGWQRQNYTRTFREIWEDISANIQISESQVRYLYNEVYLPLLACNERAHMNILTEISNRSGLILSLEGLAPEGGEPQLWVIRELQTGLTLRSGWLSQQSQIAFENFLQPIVECELNITDIMSDKQRGLVPAIQTIFPNARHSFCQAHYLKNAAEPVSVADEAMKINLRKTVRKEVGDIIKPEYVENPGVMTVTGLIPSFPSDENCPDGNSSQTLSDAETQEEITDTLLRRVRYLLTLKGRPPFRLAGIEMFELLTEISDLLKTLINHIPDERLVKLQIGLSIALSSVAESYKDIREAADWLEHISEILNPADKPPRSGDEVKEALFTYLDQIKAETVENTVLSDFADRIFKTTCNYASGLFYTYEVPELPRTNNDRESEFRSLNSRLLRTTGQKGASRRIIQRAGAWELCNGPDSLSELSKELSQIDRSEFLKEQERVRSHRKRFCLHTRSVKYSSQKLEQLKEKWLELNAA